MQSLISQPILIVDDDAAVREIVQQTLTREGYAVIGAAIGVEGIKAWEQYHPQLIILDLVMPRVNGFQILERIRQKDETPVVMLTRQSRATDKVHAFELGADDCLSKPFNSRELTVRVKAVLRRTQRSAPPIQSTELIAGELRLDLSRQRVLIENRTVPLTRTEFHILRELARTPGRILSREQLVTAIWGPEYRDDKHILRCAIYRLRQKLEPDASQPYYLRGVQGMGYWLAVPEEARA